MTVKEGLKAVKKMYSQSNLTLKDSARLKGGILLLLTEEFYPAWKGYNAQGTLTHYPAIRTTRLHTFAGDKVLASVVVYNKVEEV